VNNLEKKACVHAIVSIVLAYLITMALSCL